MGKTPKQAPQSAESVAAVPAEPVIEPSSTEPATPAADNPPAEGVEANNKADSEGAGTESGDDNVKNAVTAGKALIAEGKSKADAARAIYDLLKDEDREVVLKAFVEGATLTEKGAPTYYYNITRKLRLAKAIAKQKKAKKPADDAEAAA